MTGRDGTTTLVRAEFVEFADGAVPIATLTSSAETRSSSSSNGGAAAAALQCSGLTESLEWECKPRAPTDHGDEGGDGAAPTPAPNNGGDGDREGGTSSGCVSVRRNGAIAVGAAAVGLFCNAKHTVTVMSSVRLPNALQSRQNTKTITPPQKNQEDKSARPKRKGIVKRAAQMAVC